MRYLLCEALHSISNNFLKDKWKTTAINEFREPLQNKSFNNYYISITLNKTTA